MKAYFFIPYLVLFSLICQAQQFNWAHSYGGHINDRANATAVDSNGNIVLGGWVKYGTSFNDTIVSNGGDFIIKYTPEGEILWYYEFEDHYDLGIIDIMFDQEENILIAGIYENWIQIDTVVLSPDDNTFLLKLDANGKYQWIKTFRPQRISSITTSKNDEIIISGFYARDIHLDSVDLPGTADKMDFFVAKLDKYANVLWAKRGGGYGDDYAHAVKCDQQDNIYVVGEFNPYNATFDTFDYNLGYSAATGFISKWSRNGELLWVRHGILGYNSINSATDITIDSKGNAYVLGGFFNTVIFEHDTLFSENVKAAYLMKYDAKGNVIFARSFGSFVHQRSTSGFHNYGKVFTDARDNLLVISSFYNTLKEDRFTLNSKGLQDIFIAKYNEIGYPQWIRQIGGTEMEYVNDVAVSSDNQIYISGEYSSLTLDIDGINLSNNSGNLDTDIFFTSIFDTLSQIVCPEIMAQVISEDSFFCEGDSVQLSCQTNFGNSFHWYYQGSKIESSYYQKFWINEPGEYQAIVNSEFICPDSSEIINIDLRIRPPVTIDVSPDKVLCENDTSYLSAKLNVDYIYNWSIADSLIPNNEHILSVNQPGNYEVEVYDGFCFNSDSTSILSGKPDINLVAINGVILCPDATIKLSVKKDSSYHYEWYIEDRKMNTNTASISVFSAGIYKASVTNGFCTSYDSISIVAGGNPHVEIEADYLVIEDGPITIEAVGDPTQHYYWYKDGIQGSIWNGQVINVIDTGYYHVLSITNVVLLRMKFRYCTIVF
jgi:hypothetical protein